MRYRRVIIPILTALFFLSMLSPIAQQDRLQVVASHSILADIVGNAAADHADVTTLIPAGADPHTFVPSPGDLTRIAEADLVFINGAGFEENLLNAIESAGETVEIVNASACIEVRPFGAAMHSDDDHAQEDEAQDEHDIDDGDDHADDHDEDDHVDEHDDDDDQHADDHDNQDDHADEHADDHADDHDEMGGEPDCDDHDAEFAALVGEEEDGHARFTTLGRAQDIDCGLEHGHEDASQAHGEGACDPHVWLDPHNVIYWVLKVRDTLSAADPDNAANYSANAADLAQELVALEAEFILPKLEELPEERRVLITSHESLGYLATTFGFEIITTIVPGLSTMVEPSARDIAGLIDRIRDEGVPAMFSDTQASDSIMRTIAGEAGVKLIGLYSDTMSDSNGPASTYLDYMRYNVTTIVDALKDD